MKLKRALFAVIALCGLGVSFLVGGAALAVTCPDGTVREGDDADTYAECNLPADASSDQVFDSVSNVINVILGIMGIVAVVVIILGGFTFMTSQGDAGKVMKGRNTILWGVVGLVVALLAFTIVNFVLKGAFGNSGSGGEPNNTITPDSSQTQEPNNTITPSGSNKEPNNSIKPI